MKNLFKSCLMLTLLSGLASCESIERKSKEPFAIHVDSSGRYVPIHFVVDTNSVKVINAMAKEVQRVDSVSFGVCDTCATGFKAAILENQLLAERLARESHKLREQLQKINETIMVNNQLLDKTEEVHGKLVTIKVQMSDELKTLVTESKNLKLPPMYVKK